MFKKLQSRLTKMKVFYYIFVLFMLLIMPRIFSDFFFHVHTLDFSYYTNHLMESSKLLIGGVTFFLCHLILGSFLVNKGFSNFEKIIILFLLPFISFYSLLSFSVLKGVDIMHFSNTASLIDFSIYLIFYGFSVYLMLYLNYKNDNLDMQPKFMKIEEFIKRNHILLKNYLWLKKAP